MTPEERTNPEVQEALKAALLAYSDMTYAIERACIVCGKTPSTLRLSLDLKYATSGTNAVDVEKLSEFNSPNAMYDPRTKRVYFIDIGFGEWNSDKQEVYEYVLKQHLP
jgi:hypothetical protein